MEIMFDDLTEDAQERLLEEAGVSFPEDMHWDTIPVAVVKFVGDTPHFDDDDDDDNFATDIYDYDEDGL